MSPGFTLPQHSPGHGSPRLHLQRHLWPALLTSAISCTAVLHAAAAAPPPARAFVHPGVIQNRAELDFMKQKVLAGEQPWKGAWDRLRALSYSSLDFKPEPFAHVIRGAYGNPRIGADELSASANGAYSHALQWYVTGDRSHARKVIEIFNAWSPVLQDFQKNDAKLLAAWTGYAFCSAAELLRSTDSGWTEAERAQFKQMLLGVYYPLLKNYFPEANGNWDAAIMSTLMAMGIFCDDRAMFDSAVDHFIRGPMNGGITHYIYPSGQCEESTRDHAHTQLGLDWMARTARIARTQGVDLFGIADNRLALGFEYTAKYLSGEEVSAENAISPRIQFTDIYLAAYQYYHFEKGLDMPYTARAVERTLDKAGLSLLTFYRGPGQAAAGKGPPAKLPAPRPSPVATRGGALPQASTKPPAKAVWVSPGESIQAALDGRKARGGWVVLRRGTHTLTEPLRLSSGVTLAGEGLGTVLWLDAKSTGPAIVNASPNLQAVVLRDFVLEGATTVRLPSDPNSARRARSLPGAPRRGGLQFIAGAGQTLSRLHLEHLTVRNCTDPGLVLENAREVAILDCSFTDNGNFSTSGSNSCDNVALARVTKCRIAGNRLNNSPSGCGLTLVAGRDVSVTGNEIARNVQQGIYATGTEDLVCRGNLLEANETDGLRIDTKSGRCRGIKVLDNLVQNNGNCGIDIPGVEASKVHGNRFHDNACQAVRQ